MEELCVVGGIVGNVLAVETDEETNRGRGNEMKEEALEAVGSQAGATFGPAEDFRLGQALGLGFRRIMKLCSCAIWEDLI
jgi:hypothetical protein